MITYDFQAKQWCGIGPDQDYDLAGAIARVSADIEQFACALRNVYCAPASTYEAASWPIKRAEAKAFITSGTPSAMITTEAQSRGTTELAIAQRIMARANQLTYIEATIAGTSGKHRDAISILTTANDVLNYDWSAGWPL